MALHGGGFTLIPKSAVRLGTLPNLVSQLFTNHSEVLLFIQKKNGSQTYTLIQQLGKESHTPLVVLQNTHSGLYVIIKKQAHFGIYYTTYLHVALNGN